jgi:hypothetical protein
MGTSDISTSSNTFVLMTNMSVTMTTSGGNVFVSFHTTVAMSNKKYGEIALFIDNTEYFRIREFCNDSNDIEPVGLSYLATGLSAASHTFQIRWRVEDPGAAISQNGSTWSSGRSLTVIDLGI